MTSSVEVALVEPEIPPNTGNVARTCAATRTPLHLVEPLGFRLTDRHLKRAGLDYWPHVQVRVHPDLDTFLRAVEHRRLVFFSKKGACPYYDFDFLPGDILVFGPETRGLPEELLESAWDRVVSIPMDCEHVRSLNLATTVGVGLFEARRQLSRPTVAARTTSLPVGPLQDGAPWTTRMCGESRIP
ncbi:tRNA (cytidine(34)-2'-O)-methyltransferase [Desulfacinum hydrothermale]|nr:tRNA (cytidine(34)-2'-O)-methyltransferase [Desulfacinum hydrothermale]